MLEKLITLEEAANILGVKKHKLLKRCDPSYCEERNLKPLPYYFNGSRMRISLGLIQNIKQRWTSV